jgi:hypothetical protein
MHVFSLSLHTTQSIVIKEGKNDRIVWDGSTVMKPTDIVMNQITPVDQESPVTFGHVKLQIYIDIYNTRIRLNSLCRISSPPTAHKIPFLRAVGEVFSTDRTQFSDRTQKTDQTD